MACQKQERATIVVPLGAEIDLTNCDQVYELLNRASVSGANVVADFTETQFCDCASLRSVLAAQHRAAAHGGQLLLVIPPGSPVRRLAWLLGLNRLLPVYASTYEAAAWVPRPDDLRQRSA